MGLTHPGLGPGTWNPDTSGDTALESGALRRLHSVRRNSGRGRGSSLDICRRVPDYMCRGEAPQGLGERGHRVAGN